MSMFGSESKAQHIFLIFRIYTKQSEANAYIIEININILVYFQKHVHCFIFCTHERSLCLMHVCENFPLVKIL